MIRVSLSCLALVLLLLLTTFINNGQAQCVDCYDPGTESCLQNPQTGIYYCSCKSGWWPEKCSCFEDNLISWSPGTSTCNCKAGWTGDCSTCAVGYIGSGCQCKSNGTVSIDAESGVCQCKPGFGGYDCGGCVNGWSGSNCTICNNPPCASTCENGYWTGAECNCWTEGTSTITGNTCNCKSGWIGDSCQCIAANTASSTVGGQCICNDGYFGDRCEISRCDLCTPGNTGICIGNQCLCQPAYVGEFCEQYTCADRQCEYDATCIQYALGEMTKWQCDCGSLVPPRSGTLCQCSLPGTVSVSGMTCICDAGYNGTDCSHSINH